MKKIIGMIALGAVLTSCSITSPLTATNNPIGSKVGESTTTCVFGVPGALSSGIVTNGAYGIADAAKNGGIDKIATVDLKIQSFIFWSKNTIIVTGE